MRLDDAELVRRWQRGEPGAFEELVRHWQGPVGRLLSRLLGPGDSVQDVCQDVFLKMYTSRDRYRDNGHFAPWLYRIALNAARDAGRRRRRQPSTLEGDEPADRGVSAEQRIQREETAEAVALAVAELPEPLREVLVLRHYENMRFEDIARLTGTPASTLKSRFAAALARLRPRLEGLVDDPEENAS